MAGLKFEGDLSQISDNQLKYIQSVIEKRGYANNKVIIESIGKPGDNYVANVKRIVIDDGKGGTFKIVAKIAPVNEIMRKMSNTDLMFNNEHLMYMEILPKFTQLEIAADVPPEERLRYAACYGSSRDAPNEVILLEDLNESSFTMLDRFKSLSSDCVKSVLRNFALLHSLSYVLRYKEPETFEEFKNSLFDMWASLDTMEESKQYFLQMETNAYSVVENDVHKKAIKGALMATIKDFSKMAKYEKYSKHAVIQQGDAWNNNIMFKFDFNNNRMLVGLPRYCSASTMFAEARVDCFHATMRKRCGSLVRRVRGSPNGMLAALAGRLDCAYIAHCCEMHITHRINKGEDLLGSIMIDYQLSKATNPVSDILYMIFNCTDYETRKVHFHDWIDYYHSELDKSLSNYGLKANFVFPRDQLDADLKRYGKIGFGLSILLASMLCLKSEDASAMKEALDSADVDAMMNGVSAGIKDPETVAIIKKRLEGLVDSFQEFGLIQ